MSAWTLLALQRAENGSFLLARLRNSRYQFFRQKTEGSNRLTGARDILYRLRLQRITVSLRRLSCDTKP
jgi:hypothetical protein